MSWLSLQISKVWTNLGPKILINHWFVIKNIHKQNFTHRSVVSSRVVTLEFQTSYEQLGKYWCYIPWEKISASYSPHSGVSAQFSYHSPTALHSLPTSPCVCNLLCHRSGLQVNSSELWMSATWVATEEMGFVFVCSQSFKLLKKLLPASRFWETIFLCLYVEKKTEIVSHNTKVMWLYLLLHVTLSALLLFYQVFD